MELLRGELNILTVPIKPPTPFAVLELFFTLLLVNELVILMSWFEVLPRVVIPIRPPTPVKVAPTVPSTEPNATELLLIVTPV